MILVMRMGLENVAPVTCGSVFHYTVSVHIIGVQNIHCNIGNFLLFKIILNFDFKMWRNTKQSGSELWSWPNTDMHLHQMQRRATHGECIISHKNHFMVLLYSFKSSYVAHPMWGPTLRLKQTWKGCWALPGAQWVAAENFSLVSKAAPRCLFSSGDLWRELEFIKQIKQSFSLETHESGDIERKKILWGHLLFCSLLFVLFS